MGSDVSDFYDDFADQQVGDLLHPNPRLLAIRKRLRPVLERRPRAALDIGCGIGVTTDWLATAVPRVVGIDISPRHVAIASALYDRPDFAVCELPGDAPPPGPYGLVTLLDVLEHFAPNQRADVFRRIGEVVADDGVIAVNVPSKLYALEVEESDRQIIDEALGTDEIVGLAAGLGMEPLSVDRYGIDSPNQYVFCTFSRAYEIRRPLPGSEIDARGRVEIAVESLRHRVRARRQIPRIRGL
jgi:SAM-dependent methyltransferase